MVFIIFLHTFGEREALWFLLYIKGTLTESITENPGQTHCLGYFIHSGIPTVPVNRRKWC